MRRSKYKLGHILVNKWPIGQRRKEFVEPTLSSIKTSRLESAFVIPNWKGNAHYSVFSIYRLSCFRFLK